MHNGFIILLNHSLIGAKVLVKHIRENYQGEQRDDVIRVSGMGSERLKAAVCQSGNQTRKSGRIRGLQALVKRSSSARHVPGK
eukprot:11241060-Heterocapsa_arctica.AAC.1